MLAQLRLNSLVILSYQLVKRRYHSNTIGGLGPEILRYFSATCLGNLVMFLRMAARTDFFLDINKYKKLGLGCRSHI
jgi:hypothetical protein